MKETVQQRRGATVPQTLGDAAPRLFRSAAVAILLATTLLATTLLSSAQTTGAAAGANSVVPVPAAPVARPAEAASPPKPKLSAPVTLLPPPDSFNVTDRGHQVLSHLNAVVRFFRMAIAPIQKVGEPSDMLYRDQALAQATQVADLAFQSGRADAALIAAFERQTAPQAGAPAEGEAQKLQTVRANVTQRLADLKAQLPQLEQQRNLAKPKQRAAIEQQREQVEGDIELYTAMSDSIKKIALTSDAGANGGLAGDIDRLQHSVPELAAGRAKTIASTPLENLSAARSAGVSSQAVVLIQLLGTRHSIDLWVNETDALHDQATALRTPMTQLVRSVISNGQALSRQAEAATAAPVSAPVSAPKSTQGTAAAAKAPAVSQPPIDDVQAVRRRYDQVTATFNALSAALVPLTQEIITLEQSRANLLVWRAVVASEYQDVLQHLLLQVLAIALALGALLVLSKLWQRATLRYVHEARRRRQLMVTRRVVIYFLSGIILIFGFVTQFSSLATFAGFITAGIAVGLQTILLSVAAYFFIVGRYGVRVGDRITVVGVTGDVIEVGLVRFYMMELAGSGTELQPTGRIAVFANSVLFQSGTPLYRQMPGAEYAWHELSVTLSAKADYARASSSLSKLVEDIYSEYKQRIESQHLQVESWMDAPIPSPTVDSRMQLVEGGVQLYVRYPVELREASQTDQKVTHAVVTLMEQDAEVKEAISSPPIIRAIVKG